MRRKLVTLETAVQTIVQQHGGIRAAARATGVDKGFISRLMSGKKVNPSDETLEALGLYAVPLYEVVQPWESVLPFCMAGKDGDCTHPGCPQLRDKEPATSGRHCPLDTGAEQAKEKPHD